MSLNSSGVCQGATCYMSYSRIGSSEAVGLIKFHGLCCGFTNLYYSLATVAIIGESGCVEYVQKLCKYYIDVVYIAVYMSIRDFDLRLPMVYRVGIDRVRNCCIAFVLHGKLHFVGKRSLSCLDMKS